MNEFEKNDALEGIAIIGMAGRFPGAPNIETFWHNLSHGVESISFFSDQELREAGVEEALLNNKDYVRAAGMLEGTDLFDAHFFGYSPREAEFIDPQQRLFLECAWAGLEDAGHDPEQYDGAIGVYAGSSLNAYLMKNLLFSKHFQTMGEFQTIIGNDKDFLATRTSYKFDLKGPSINVQTACSTSLVAVQLAVQGLLNYQCDMALAGGVSVRVPQKSGYLYQEGNILSPEGRCKAFDESANGTVIGEGVGVVVLKRVEDALEDGDSIYAVIRGSALNNDGSLKAGYTAPSIDGQTDVIAMAQAIAGFEADSITYVETHGTGTPLGDPIEMAGLTNAFRMSTDKNHFCAIGSVKTNIGHLDIAAGIASLIKTVLCLKHRQIVPSLHFKKANPKLDLENSPFYVATALENWDTGASPRRAGVSSFGIGGTNVHLVLEEGMANTSSPGTKPWQLLLLSAKTETALQHATEQLAAHLDTHQEHINLADAAFTLQAGRKHFNHRRFALCQNTGQAVNVLQTMDPQQLATSYQEYNQKPVLFMFSGQGTQYIEMALDLYTHEPLFRETIDQCAEITKKYMDSDIREILFPQNEQKKEAREKINQTLYAQPAIFIIEYGLARLLMSWDIVPEEMIGHSIGEYVAACIAGVFSLEDALQIITRRAALMHELPRGAMLSVPLPEQYILPLLNNNLSLAAINGQSSCVIAGTEQEIEALQEQLRKKELACQLLHTSHAFHSRMMEPVLETFKEFIQQFTLNIPDIPYISNLSGTWITPEEATDPNYWSRHLRHTVRFADGIQELLKNTDRVFLEVGAGQTLSSLLRQNIETPGALNIYQTLRHPREALSDHQFLMKTVGNLWLAGVAINWNALHTGEKRQRISLPTYPFDRKQYWIHPDTKLERGNTCDLAPGPDTDSSKLETNDTLFHARQHLSHMYVAPRTELEKIIAHIWGNLFGIPQIGIHDSFFELGGHSLLASQAIARLRETLHIEIPLYSIFEAPTVEQLAELVAHIEWAIKSSQSRLTSHEELLEEITL